MGKRKKLKKFWNEKVVPNKGKIASRVIKTGAVYILTGPKVALAFNATELTESYGAISGSCLGGRVGFLPVPSSYFEGAICTAMLLTCGAAAAQSFGNTTVNAACVALIRTLSGQKTA